MQLQVQATRKLLLFGPFGPSPLQFILCVSELKLPRFQLHSRRKFSTPIRIALLNLCLIWARVFACCLFFYGPVSQALVDSSHPLLQGPFFWEKNPQLLRQLNDERKILVSTQAQKVEGKENWSLKAVGLVQVPADQAFAYMMNFERLKNKPHFQKIEWNPQLKILKLQFKSSQIQDEFEFQLDPKPAPPSSNLEESKVFWSLNNSKYKGSSGFVRLSPKGEKSTEVALVSFYPGEIPWYKSFFIKIGLEALLKHMATELRKDLESQCALQGAASSPSGTGSKAPGVAAMDSLLGGQECRSN